MPCFIEMRQGLPNEIMESWIVTEWRADIIKVGTNNCRLSMYPVVFFLLYTQTYVTCIKCKVTIHHSRSLYHNNVINVVWNCTENGINLDQKQPVLSEAFSTCHLCEIIVLMAESSLGVIQIIPSFLVAHTLCPSGMSKKWSLKRINTFKLLDKLGILLYNDGPLLSRLKSIWKNPFRISLH